MKLHSVLAILLILPGWLGAVALAQEPQQLPLTCQMTAQGIEGEPGTTVAATCPANCPLSTIWGTDTYTDDSSVCVAALHAGVITSEGGPLMITIEAGQQSYVATTRNGVSSNSYPEWRRSFRVAGAAEGERTAQQDPVEPAGMETAATCEPRLPDEVVFQNAAQQYCLSHNSRWEVVEESSSSVTIRIPPATNGESIALNINVADVALQEADLDAVIDRLIQEFFPQQNQFQQVQVLERADATVAGQPAKFLAFGGKLAAGDQLLDVVGHVYVFSGPNAKLYSLTFVMDTSRMPQAAYQATVDGMRDSFLVTAAGP